MVLVEDGTTTKLVPANPFGSQPEGNAVVQANFSPADAKVAMRVDAVGRKVLEANPRIDPRPLFATIRHPKAEVFHQGDRLVYVTEGLVALCKTDAELAAVLSRELAEMVAARESRPVLPAPGADLPPPVQVRIGHDDPLGAVDRTSLAELAKFEKSKERGKKPATPADVPALAQGFLEAAGFRKEDLERAQPILRQAEQNVALERQIKGMRTQWTP